MAQWRQFLTGEADAKLPKHLTFIGGLGAGLFSVATTSPFDVVKTRMQSTDAKLYEGTFDCFAQILRREGPLAFFNGALARAAALAASHSELSGRGAASASPAVPTARTNATARASGFTAKG